MKNFFRKHKKLTIVLSILVVLIAGGVIAVYSLTKMPERNGGSDIISTLQNDPEKICSVYNSPEYNQTSSGTSSDNNSSGRPSGNFTPPEGAPTRANDNTSDDNSDARASMEEITSTLDTICQDNNVSSDELSQLEELKNDTNIESALERPQNNNKIGFITRLKMLFNRGQTGQGRPF